jgi:hypothetical protein
VARPRPPLIAAAAAVVLAVAVVLLRASPAPPPRGWLPGAPPESYRVTYRVVESARESVETVEVTPARTRRVVSRDGAPVSGTVTAERAVYVLSGGTWAELQIVGPGEAGDALWLRSPLASAERRGLARRDGTGTVAGRECTWWATLEPLDAGAFAAATGSSRARSCVDRAGLLLADTWTLDGREVRSRTATAVALSTTLADPFGGATPKPLDPRLRTTVVTAVPAPAVAAPPGLTAERSVRLTDSDPATPGSPVRVRARTVCRGAGEIAVVQDVQDLPGPTPLGSGTPVAAGGLRGVLRATAGGLVVEVLRQNGHLLTVRTSLDEEAVVRWLASL